jgi:hypothetical protein
VSLPPASSGRRRQTSSGYDAGAIIRSKHGLYIAIPRPAAGRFGDRRQKITPRPSPGALIALLLAIIAYLLVNPVGLQ